MELRRFAVCLAFFVLAVSQCSEARHSVQRRQAVDDVNYDDSILADEAGEDDTQNDTEDSEPASQKPPAVIETAPRTYEVKGGEEVRLACKVNPEEGSVIQWSKNNEPYFMGGLNLHNVEGRYSIAPNSKDMVIKNVKVSDSGVFKCEVLQATPTAINHTLLVTEAPRIVEMSATNGGFVGEGQELVLTCVVTGFPVPTLMWSLTREGLPNVRLTEKDGEYSVNGNLHSLYIKNVKKDQGGQYYCYAINNIGNHTAETVVVVNPKPRVHVARTIVNSALNIEAVLECTAHEERRPHIRWYKDGTLIERPSANLQITTHGSHSNLTIIPAADTDFGTFTCEAENAYGKHNKSVELVESPVVEDLEVEGTKMSWTVRSHQPLEQMEVQLMAETEDGEQELRKLTVPLPEGGHHMYDISYLLEDKQLQPGEYQAVVKVKNSHSWGGSNEPAVVTIEDAQPQYIQHASVFRQSAGAAHSIRPAYTVLSAILMYLLVRML